jgi:hypothetical protein
MENFENIIAMNPNTSVDAAKNAIVNILKGSLLIDRSWYKSGAMSP